MRGTSARLSAATVVLFVVISGTQVAHADDDKSDGIAVSYDAASGETTIYVRATNGEVAWSDVVRGLARAKGFDDKALIGVLPSGTFEIDSFTGLLALAAISRALSPAIELDSVRYKGKRTLAVRLSKRALLASERKLKNMLHGSLGNLVGSNKDQKYSLEMSKGWYAKVKKGKPLVILVHGFQSTPEDSATAIVQERLNKRGWPTGALRFPNDQPISRSAELFSRDLKKLAKKYPRLKIRIVAKSMGGLVARAVIEDPALDPGNVIQLIQVATPNHGSNLAHFGFALELWEHVPKLANSPAQAFYESIEDGLGQAGDDMIPGSNFLVKLNARKRNPKVAYSVFLGSKAYLSQMQLTILRAAMRTQNERNRFVRFFGKKLDSYLADLDEVVDGKGDGAVAIDRGKLDGVDDIVIMPFGHLAGREATELWDALIERLDKPPPVAGKGKTTK